MAGGTGNVARSFATGSNAGNVQPVIGTPNMRWDELKGECRGGGSPEEFTTRVTINFLHESYFERNHFGCNENDVEYGVIQGTIGRNRLRELDSSPQGEIVAICQEHSRLFVA